MFQKARDLWVGVGVILVGAAFLYETMRIDDAADEVTGPMLAPFGVSILIILLGGIQVILGAIASRSTVDEPVNDAGTFKPLRLAAVVGGGIGFVILFPIVGYMFSTLVTLVFMMLLFGNRMGARFAGIAVIGAVFYQIVFIELMGVHDPVGGFAFKSLFG